MSESSSVEPLDEVLKVCRAGFRKAEMVARLRFEEGIGGVECCGEKGTDR